MFIEALHAGRRQNLSCSANGAHTRFGLVSVGEENVWDGLAIIRPPRLCRLHPGSVINHQATARVLVGTSQMVWTLTPLATQVAEGISRWTALPQTL